MRHFLGVLAVAGPLTGCSVDFQGWAGMKDQPKAMAYRESGVFEDERAMRVPPPGTVPREYMGRSRRVRTGGDTVETSAGIPVALTREFVEEGHRSFDIYCATCHGVRGDGASPVARKMGLRAPPSLLELPAYADGHYFNVVGQGFGLMPGYAEKLTPEQRWAVVAYVRALQASQRVRLEDVPPEVRERLLQEKAP